MSFVVSLCLYATAAFAADTGAVAEAASGSDAGVVTGQGENQPPKKVRSWKDAAKELHAPAAEVLPDVLVYGAEWCGPCHKLRAWLTGQEINFGYVDIEKNTAGRRRLVQLKKQQHIEGGNIPVVEIKGTLYVGFHRDELEPALEALLKSKP